MAKIIICHCEDVSLQELLSALEQGYQDIETIKRYTGIGTGKCQGKCCLVQTLGLLAREGIQAALSLPTIRQPVLPLRIDDIVKIEGEKKQRPGKVP